MFVYQATEIALLLREMATADNVNTIEKPSRQGRFQLNK